MHRQVGAFSKALSQQAIGILVPSCAATGFGRKTDIDVGRHRKAPMIRQFLARSQVSDLDSSSGSFFACWMSALTTVWVSLPATLAKITHAFDAGLRSRCRCCSSGQQIALEWPGTARLQPPPDAHGLRRHPSYVPVHRYSYQPSGVKHRVLRSKMAKQLFLRTPCAWTNRPPIDHLVRHLTTDGLQDVFSSVNRLLLGCPINLSFPATACRAANHRQLQHLDDAIVPRYSVRNCRPGATTAAIAAHFPAHRRG